VTGTTSDIYGWSARQLIQNLSYGCVLVGFAIDASPELAHSSQKILPMHCRRDFVALHAKPPCAEKVCLQGQPGLGGQVRRSGSWFVITANWMKNNMQGFQPLRVRNDGCQVFIGSRPHNYLPVPA
jgi:hypothetical protein